MCGGRVNGSAGEGLCSVACALRQDQRGLTSGSNCASICTLVCCPSTTDSFMNWPTSTRRPSPTSNAPYYEFSRRRSVTLSPTGCEVLWWVCMSVCLSVCLLAYLRKHTFEHQQIFRSSPERWPNKPGKNVRPSVCPSVHPYVHPYIHTSAIKLNAATNQIVVFVKIDETFMTIWLSRSSEVRVKVRRWPQFPIRTIFIHVAYGHVSVLWWLCDMLCTFSFVDDIMFQ